MEEETAIVVKLLQAFHYYRFIIKTLHFYFKYVAFKELFVV